MSTPPPYTPTRDEMGGSPPGYTEQTQPSYTQPPDCHQSPVYPQQHAMSAVHSGETTLLMQHCRESPILTVCPYCRATIITAVHYQVGTFALLMSGAIFFVGGWLGCFLIPCCIEGCKDAVHSCPKCGKKLASWSRL